MESILHNFLYKCFMKSVMKGGGVESKFHNFLYQCCMKNPMMSVADTFPNLDQQAEHVLAEKGEGKAIAPGLQAKLRNGRVEVLLGGHVHEPTAEAVLGKEDEKDDLEDAADALQLGIVKVLEDKGGDRGDDADEEVGTGQRHKGRAEHYKKRLSSF